MQKCNKYYMEPWGEKEINLCLRGNDSSESLWITQSWIKLANWNSSWNDILIKCKLEETLHAQNSTLLFVRLFTIFNFIQTMSPQHLVGLIPAVKRALKYSYKDLYSWRLKYTNYEINCLNISITRIQLEFTFSLILYILHRRSKKCLKKRNDEIECLTVFGLIVHLI